MKSILIISNTYYQLITAIRLKETCWKNESVDIVVSNHSNNSEKITLNLKMLNIFNNVFYAKTSHLCQNRKSIYLKFKRWQYIIGGIFWPEITDKQYDELVYYNPDIFVYGIFARLIKNNNHMICSRYEEGILSYTDTEYLKHSQLNYANMIRKYWGKELLENRTLNFYCFYPQLYSGKLHAIRILQIDNYEKTGILLKKIFDISTEILNIDEKYIFFTSVFDFEGGKPIGEYELVSKVSEMIGKENLIIKTHPRDARTIYEDNGFKVYKSSSIPWEAIQLNNDFSDKIFLTVNSGSVLGVNMMLQNQTRTLFLCDCCNITNNTEAVISINEIKKLLSTSDFISDKISIADNIEKIKEI